MIGWLDNRDTVEGHGHEDALIGAIWAVGMVVGILFIAKTPGYNVELMSYLFGSILTSGPDGLRFMSIGLAVVALAILLFWRPLVAVSLDPEFARLRGLPVNALNYLLLVLIAVSVVLLIQVVGLILVLALLTLPAATAAHLVRGRVGLVVLTSVAGLTATLIGVQAAVTFDARRADHHPPRGDRHLRHVNGGAKGVLGYSGKVSCDGDAAAGTSGTALSRAICASGLAGWRRAATTPGLRARSAASSPESPANAIATSTRPSCRSATIAERPKSVSRPTF